MSVVLARQEMWPELQRERAVTLGEGVGPPEAGRFGADLRRRGVSAASDGIGYLDEDPGVEPGSALL